MSSSSASAMALQAKAGSSYQDQGQLDALAAAAAEVEAVRIERDVALRALAGAKQQIEEMEKLREALSNHGSVRKARHDDACCVQGTLVRGRRKGSDTLICVCSMQVEATLAARLMGSAAALAAGGRSHVQRDRPRHPLARGSPSERAKMDAPPRGSHRTVYASRY